MKRFLSLYLMLMFVASLAFAQAGSISIYADPGGNVCEILDMGPGLIQVHIVHAWHPGMIQARFSAPPPGCAGGLVWLGDLFPPLSIALGMVDTGVIVAFPVCQPTPTLLATRQYFGLGSTTPCCYWPVLPDPAAPTGLIEALDCTVSLAFPTGGEAIVNPTSQCRCVIPVEETTWGKMKALYAD